MDAQSRWEDQRARDCSEHGQPRCSHFPDHGCRECHESHKEEGEFNKFCQKCQDEICAECGGTGMINDAECPRCHGTGRIDP